ncbi:MAG: FAD-binding oxidoreductase [Myxococcota bacterium]
MSPDDLGALREALGERGVHEHEPRRMEGVAPSVTLEPDEGVALAAALRILAGRRRAVLVRGGGSRLGLGNPATRADAFLSTRRLAGILELDAEEGVVHVRAGTPLATLRAAAVEAGWELPLDPPGAGSSVGGVLAIAALGPRALGHGRVRDVVLGLEVVLGSGERTRCGGRVVKNVTGYDLQKLYAGSFGTLAVIEAAWLRLRPRPERVALWAARLGPGQDPLALGLEVARGAAARAVAVLDPGLASGLPGVEVSAGSALLVVELAGGEPVVEQRGSELRARLGAEPAKGELLDGVRERQGGRVGEAGLLLRVDALAPRLPAAARALGEAGGSVLAYPGLGLLYADFEVAAVEPALAAAREAASRGGGGWRIEAAPLELRREHEVFGDPPEALAVMRALKDRYDPAGVLNPGRFLGGL